VSDQAGFDLDLNAGGYIQQAGQALSTTTALEQSISRLAVTSGVMGRSWQQASPSRQHIAAFGAYTAAAAAQERALSGLAATQAVTGQSAERLGRGMRSLAREMPVGQRATQQTVETINQLGVAAAGQERKVVSLGRIVTQLQGANSGTFAPQLAQGMAQLERTFGDRGLDPKRVRDTGDALTTVSKQAGASAQGVLDFTNAIGPMAQAAGIGKTASLGIGASFSRIGQDGTAAAGAVNKMLSDMSKAVRDGGPEMATYADIVGTTADNFERLFKNNPAEALTRVTEAIGRNPTEGPRQLERLGLEGVRTQRALQAVSASGGLREQINTSLGAYGNDATKRASDAAFKGVLDNFQKAGTAAGQLSAAIGTPLLRPLGTFASLLAKVTSVGAGVADSGAGRTALAGAAYGGIGLLLARRVFGVGLGGAAVQQGLTSGPVSSALAGYRMGRGANVMRDEAGAITRVGGFLGRPAGAMARAAEEGRIGQGMLGGANQRIFGLARGAGERVGEMRTEQFGRARERMAARFGEGSAELAAWERTQAGGGPGMVSRISRGVRGTAGVVGAAYMRANAAQFAAANEMDPTQREGVVRGRLSFLGGNVGAFARGIPSDIRGAGSVGEAGSRLSSSFREMTNRIGETNRVLPNFTRGLSAFARMSMDSGSFMGRTAIGGARGLGRAGAGLMGALGGPWGLAITGGLALGSYALQQRSQGRQQRADEVQRQNDASPSAGIDRYNEAIGKATSSTSSFADAIQSSTRQISASVTDMSTATRIRPEDVAAAQQAPKPVTAYPAGSTPEQLSARIRQFAPGGLDPSQLNSIKVDLLRQFPQQVVDQTLGQLGPDAQAGGVAGQRQLSGAGDLSTLVRQAGDIPVDVSKGVDRNRISSQQYNSPFLQVPGGRYHLKQSQRDILDTASGSVSQRYTSQNEMFGSGFAQQQRLQDVNAAMMAAAQQGNEPVVDQLGQQFARQQLGIQNPPKISSDDIKKHGGYVQALAAKNQQFGGQLGSMTAPTAQGGQGISLTPGQGLAPTLQRSNLANQMQQFGTIAPFFDNTLQAPHGMGRHSCRPRGPRTPCSSPCCSRTTCRRPPTP
jgi:TP901 family phage tail tape measure protein